MRKIDKYLRFTICLIVVATIIYTILQIIFKDVDFLEYYRAFIGIFGAPEIIGCVIIKVFNIKKGE